MKTKKRATIAGREVELSNLDKLMYPEVGFTKSQVIDYYTRVSPYILPHIENRPITLKRYPNGVGGEHFYEKNAPSYTPKWVKTFPIKRTSGESVINYILINDPATLVWSANTANLEIHPFLAKAPHIEIPTMVVFDLDPGEGADILKSCEAAFLVKNLLDRLKLESFVKVSGSKGVHLHVPLNTRVTYSATQAFAKSVAQLLESEHPDWIISEMPKAKRQRKVFVDWSQNSVHKSTVAVYSLRAKSARPFVAMPLDWEELKRVLKKRDRAALFLEPEPALKRLDSRGDLFAPVLKLKQKLPKQFLDIPTDERPEVLGDELKPLETYRRKRDFSKTPEPPPAIHKASSRDDQRLFVIQKHAASHLHYDLRLEMHGVLKSWAIPKGPPYELNEKRLAMATEDHPMEYARFEGSIPAGEYGGGTVMVWDIGTYRILDGNYWNGKLHIVLNGKKLNGEWVLVRAGQRNGKQNSWLWIKAGTPLSLLSPKERDASALTGRSMEEIAQAQDAVWHSNRAATRKPVPSFIPSAGSGEAQPRDAGEERGRGQSSRKTRTSLDLESLPNARLSFIEPMLAKPVSALPEDARQWLYEIKLDGYRCLGLRNEKGVRLYSRNKNVLNSRFPKIAAAMERLEPAMMTDGEIVALDQAGRPSFNILQNHRSTAEHIYYYVFDLLIYKGKSLLRVPLEQRRELLKSAIEPLPETIRLSENFAGEAKEIAATAEQLGVEGVIAKRRNSAYEPGERSGAWVKYRINQGQELVIGGYLPGPQYFDSLLAGYYRSNKLLFIGKIRNGFVPRVRRELFERLEQLRTDVCPFANLPEPKTARRGKAITKEVMKECVWVKPKLVAQVEFTEWTDADHLRHARFVGLRDDKNPREVRRGETAPAE
jgi:bifunctional non-homologous end joining protein LigD